MSSVLLISTFQPGVSGSRRVSYAGVYLCFWWSNTLKNITTRQYSLYLCAPLIRIQADDAFNPTLHPQVYFICSGSAYHCGDKCTFGIRILWSFYCRCTVRDEMVHGAKMRQSRCEFVAALKGLCTEECVWTALVAVLVSRDLSLYIVYIV